MADELFEALHELWGGDLKHRRLRTQFRDHALELRVVYDQGEFLELALTAEMDERVTIRTEDFGDRVAKSLHLAEEFQTGDKNFDAKFFIRTPQGVKPTWLIGENARRLVESTDPFHRFHVHEHGIRWSAEMTPEITPARIEAVATALADLVTFLRE